MSTTAAPVASSSAGGDIAVENGTSGQQASGDKDQGKEPDELLSKRKRRRITQACRRCKQRRARCDGAQPACGECVKGDAVCEQPDPNEDGRKRRGRKAAGTSVPPDARQPLAEGAAVPGCDAAEGRAQGVAPGGSPAAARPPDFEAGLLALPSTSLGPYAAPATSSGLVPSGATASPVFPLPTPSAPPASFAFPQSAASSSFPSHSAVHLLAEAATMPALSPFNMFAPVSAPEEDQRSSPAAGGLTCDDLGTSTSTQQRVGLSASQNDEAAVSVPQLSYLRPFGPTGIQPGLEQIVITIAAPPAFSRDHSPSLPDNPYPFSAFDPSASLPTTSFQHGSQIPAISSAPPPRAERFFEDGSDLPRPEIKAELFDVFFRHLGSHFPFLDRRAVYQLDNRNAPASIDTPMLINAICALAARFSDSPAVKGPDAARCPGLYGVPFADKAKSMLIPLLGYPSVRTVQALLLLAWSEFGMNNDGSFWSFSGMALRMAQDLGLHLDIEHTHVDPYSRAVSRLTWWAVLAHDRMLAMGTGRPVTIKSYEISVGPPTDEDIRIVSGIEATTPSPFPPYCHLMLIAGDLSDLVNNVKGKWTLKTPPDPLHPPTADSADDACPPHQEASVRSLEPLEDAITRTYAELPPSLRWSSLNFRKQHDAGCGPIFLHLHLWYNCILILLYRPPLIYPRTKAANMSLADRLSVVTRCCLQVSQIVGVCDLVGEHADYESAPFLNQCFFVAASAWTKEHHIRTGQCVLASSTSGSHHATPTDLLAASAAENFALCHAVLKRQEKYWLGAGWLGALAGEKGAQASRPSIKTATRGLSTFVSEAEMAIFRRLAKRIGGEAHTPELDNDALTAFFNALQTDNFAAQSHQLTSDDLAFAYTFASNFQDPAQAVMPFQLSQQL